MVKKHCVDSEIFGLASSSLFHCHALGPRRGCLHKKRIQPVLWITSNKNTLIFSANTRYISTFPHVHNAHDSNAVCEI